MLIAAIVLGYFITGVAFGRVFWLANPAVYESLKGIATFEAVMVGTYWPIRLTYLLIKYIIILIITIINKVVIKYKKIESNHYWYKHNKHNSDNCMPGRVINNIRELHIPWDRIA